MKTYRLQFSATAVYDTDGKIEKGEHMTESINVLAKTFNEALQKSKGRLFSDDEFEDEGKITKVKYENIDLCEMKVLAEADIL